jgi:purine catabolism regulator
LPAAPVDGELALVVPLPDNGSAEDPETAMEKHLRELLPELRSLLNDAELKMYAGKIAERPEDLPGSWVQATRARQVAEVCGLTGDILVYGKLGVYTLL